jgi:tryptophan-rich sensory protein
MTLSLFLVFLAACGAAAATGLIFKPGDWYDGLIKPEWTPPKIAFPVAWSVLYILIAYAGARVAVQPGNGMAMGLFALQLALNTLWTPVFFGAHRIWGGLVVMALLWLTVLIMVGGYWGLDIWASVLMLPYLGWLTLAGALNLWIWRNNRVQEPADA